jgi:hypothetical protein
MRTHESAADDAHLRATDWILQFAAGEPPRDVAIHARYCADCRRTLCAADSLLAVDVSQASAPLVQPLVAERRQLAPRAVLGGASLLVLVMAGFAGLNGVQTGTNPPPSAAAQGVLGGVSSVPPSAIPTDASVSVGDATPRPRPTLLTPAPSRPPVALETPEPASPGQPSDPEPTPPASPDATRVPTRKPGSPTPTPVPPNPTPPPPTPTPISATPTPPIESTPASPEDG